ncbi:MAG TPA: nuclear transport factor 2 family protein [Actinomycetota bacterium]|nr:nuclear transport factor 2 family protein [Actinomycetota bacterium]
MTEPGEVVRGVWERFEARDWDEAADLLAEDLVIDWPNTGERFRGRDNFIAMNRNHPAADWHIQVRRIVASGPDVAAEVLVPHADGLDACLGFYEVADGRITTGREYWVEIRPQSIPDWRAAWTEPIPTNGP